MTGEPHPESMYPEMGARMRAALKDAGLNISQAALALGVADNTVGYWLIGKRRIQAHDLVAFAELVGVPAGWLLTGQPVPAGCDDITGCIGAAFEALARRGLTVEPKLLTAKDAEPPAGTILRALGTKWVSLGPGQWVNLYNPVTAETWFTIVGYGPVTICE